MRNLIRRNRHLLLLVLLLWSSTAIAETLKGGVKHETTVPVSGDILQMGESEPLPAGAKFSESVEPVGKDLRLHKLFSSVSLPTEDKEDTWYKIPAWRAGFFHREKQIDHTALPAQKLNHDNHYCLI